MLIKKIGILILLCFLSFSAYTQKKQKIPVINLRNLESKIVSTKEFKNEGKPIVLCFWATWCKPCIRELSIYNDNYTDWKEETGVKIIAVSVDDTRSKSKVAPFVKGRNWEFEIYLDTNGDLKRALNVSTVPHTFLINGKGEIIWQHNSFAEGDEEVLYGKILEITK